MKRAVAISWHRYQPHYGESYRVMFEYWLKRLSLWADEFDHLYLIDSDMNFIGKDYERIWKLVKKTTILKRELDGHHWVQFKWLIPQIEEENILFLDNDVVINKGVVDGWFKLVEKGADFVGSFDGSGGHREEIQNKFPLMKKLNATRMGSYYFILTKKLLSKIGDYDFAPIYEEKDWYDSFGLFTVKMLEKKAKIKVIPDPRDSIYLQSIENIGWVIAREPETPINLGYYHIRNGNLANYVLSSHDLHPEDYLREINGNKRELLRSLAWFYVMDEDLKFWEGVKIPLNDLGVSEEIWDNYIKEFTIYHNL